MLYSKTRFNLSTFCQKRCRIEHWNKIYKKMTFRPSHENLVLIAWATCWLITIIWFSDYKIKFVSYRQAATTLTSLHIHAVLSVPEMLFPYAKCSHIRRLRPKIEASSPTGCVSMDYWRIMVLHMYDKYQILVLASLKVQSYITPI